MPDAILRTVVCQVTLALHYCHTPTSSKGVVLHRDVKPENGAKVSLELESRSTNANDFLLTARGNIKLGDFGLAKQLGHTTTLARSNVGVS